MRKKKMITILVLLLAIGFASVSTTLVITGLVGISSKQSDFDVIFTNAKLDNVERKDFIKGEEKQLIQFETETITELNVPTTLEYEVTNKSRLYDAEVSIVCNIVDNEGNETTNDYISIGNTPEEMIVRAGENGTGSITATLIKTSTEEQDIKIKCTLNASGTERTSLGEVYVPTVSFPEGYVLKDANDNKTADIGEEIKVGTESFYVISNNGTELNALAKYNLKVGNISTNYTLERIMSSTEDGYGRQNAQMRGHVSVDEKKYGTVAFSNDKGWTKGEDIDIKQYDGPVKTALYGEDGESGYQSYIRQTIPTATVRLITKGELRSLGCSVSKCNLVSVPEWVYSTSYWVQSSNTVYDSFVWNVRSDGFFNYGNHTNGYDYGVRPVITISLS